MTKECMTTIWSLARAGEVSVRIYYVVERPGTSGVIRLAWVERFEL